MTNYKPAWVEINAGGLMTKVPNGAKVVSLFDKTDVNAAVDSMFNLNDGALYSSSKVFVVLGITLYVEGVAGGVITIHEGATEDAQTLLLSTLTIPKIDGLVYTAPVHLTFSTGKFVVIDPNAASIRYITMIGYEIDALVHQEMY